MRCQYLGSNRVELDPKADAEFLDAMERVHRVGRRVLSTARVEIAAELERQKSAHQADGSKVHQVKTIAPKASDSGPAATLAPKSTESSSSPPQPSRLVGDAANHQTVQQPRSSGAPSGTLMNGWSAAQLSYAQHLLGFAWEFVVVDADTANITTFGTQPRRLFVHAPVWNIIKMPLILLHRPPTFHFVL